MTRVLSVLELTGGLDTRRLPETTTGGVLIQASDGHITRGGEFEKRAAFVEAYELPAGTIGLAAARSSLTVFGHAAAPTMPPGVAYQRLRNPDDLTDALVNVPSYDLYSGKLYVAAEFESGARIHFYDGVAVTDWYDGRARASFTVTAGAVNPAVAATGTFEITGGTAGLAPDHQITDVKINGVSLVSGPVLFVTDNTTTAAAVASAITSHVSTPDYTAANNGQTVGITAAATGPGINGKSIVVTVTEDVTVVSNVPMQGGADASTSTLTDIKVNTVSIIGAPVTWTTNNNATAEDVSDAINAHTSTPEYEALFVNNAVTIIADAAGAAPNGLEVTFTLADGFGVSPTTLTLQGGTAEADIYDPGAFVYTLGSKMYSVAGPNLYFSGIGQPTQWTTDAVGAGFIDMSSQAAGFEALIAVAKYQQYIAIFAESAVQVWFVDPDPTLNRQVQVLANTGTISARSVTPFSDNDLFYLSESGLRSLRARDSSNAAATTDIGVPVDTLIVDAIRPLTAEERAKTFGLIEPQDSRFWLCIKDTIYVFSYFGGAKVSAWTTYSPGFEIEDAAVYKRRVYLRSEDVVYVYGGLGTTLVYDDTEAVAQLPYLDANAPTKQKILASIDAAVRGEWEIRMAMQVTDAAASDKIATIYETTFNGQRIGMIGQASHFSPIFRSKGDGAAKLGSIAIMFDDMSDAD